MPHLVSRRVVRRFAVLAACSMAASGAAMVIAVLAASAFLRRGTWDTTLFVVVAVPALATAMGLAAFRVPTGRYPGR